MTTGQDGLVGGWMDVYVVDKYGWTYSQDRDPETRHYARFKIQSQDGDIAKLPHKPTFPEHEVLPHDLQHLVHLPKHLWWNFMCMCGWVWPRVR